MCREMRWAMALLNMSIYVQHKTGIDSENLALAMSGKNVKNNRMKL